MSLDGNRFSCMACDSRGQSASILLDAMRGKPPPLRDSAPLPERLARGRVERLGRPIADESGAVSWPWRAIDILAAMERRGAISAEMRAAGEDFRAAFHTAHLDPLRAANLERVPSGQHSGADSGAAARERVWRAMVAVGGMGSPAGSCLWHVVGGELSLRQWSLRQGWGGRTMRPDAAAGVLIAALGTLAAHWKR